MSEQPIQVGDMVVLIVDLHPNCYGSRAGLRRGSVGTVTNIGSYKCSSEPLAGIYAQETYPLMIDWKNVDQRFYRFVVNYHEVRRIPPPERGDWASLEDVLDAVAEKPKEHA